MTQGHPRAVGIVFEAALRCGQLFARGYGQGRVDAGPSGRADPAELPTRFPVTEPLARGSIGHVGLAHLYKRFQRAQAPSPVDPASAYHSPLDAMKLCADSFGEIGRDMLPVASAAVRRYANHYGSEPFEVVAIEQLYETEFFGWRYTARVDLVIRDRAGKIWFVDHKFIYRIEGKIYRRYVLSGQFLGLAHLGSRAYGSDFGGVRLNLIGCAVPGFDRATPEPAPWMLERFPWVVKHAEEKIARIEAGVKAGEPVEASPSEHTCITSYGECAAFNLCQWGPGTIEAMLQKIDE